MQFTWKKNESVDPLKLTFIANRHLCAESTRATSRMMVLACIVAFPMRKKRCHRSIALLTLYVKQ